MIAWMIYYRDSARYNERYIEFYIDEGRKLGIEVRLILVEDLDFGVCKNEWFITHKGMNINYPDFVICRAIYPLLTRHLEYMNIPVFNNYSVAELCNDKAKTYQYLAKTGIKMIDTVFCINSLLYNKMRTLKNTTVVKAVDGHGGSQVFLYNPINISDSEIVINSSDNNENIPNTNNIDSNIDRILNGIGSSNSVLQPLTGRKHQDLRVYVIGKNIIAAVLRTSQEGFRSNYSLGGEVRLYELSQEEIDIVNIIIEQFDFGLVGIDFLIGDNGKLIFNEIEDVVGSRMLYSCSDINIVKLYLEYIRSFISSKDM